MMDRKNRIISGIALLLFIVLIGIMIKDLFPLVMEIIKDKSDEAKMVHYMDAYGAKGVPILMGLQILQIVLVVIPAQPIQILIGLCYGVWLGLIIGVVGDALSKGNYTIAIVIGAVVVLLLSMVFIFKNKILNKLKHTMS